MLVWNVIFPKGTDLIDQTLILAFEDFFIFQDFEGETLHFSVEMECVFGLEHLFFNRH